MKHSLKGALLSGLVFPGLGQIVLKHYKRGTLFILMVVAGFLAIVIKGVQIALAILTQIEAEGGMIDPNTIHDAATRAVTGSDSLIITFALCLIIFCWIISVVDAYRLGKHKDKEKPPAVQA